MSDDDSEMWAEIREANRKKKIENAKKSLQILEKSGLTYRRMAEENYHYRIGEWDIWLSTGKFVNRETKYKGRGIFNLLKILKT